MPDNLPLDDSARFATAQMMPLGDEEVNALWGRKMAWNDGRAIGAWGTLFAEKVSNNLASAWVEFVGFNQLPSVDWYQYRGGSQPAFVTNSSDTIGLHLGIYPIIEGGTRFTWSIWGDAQEGTLINFTEYGTWQKDFGTIIYRLRGW